MQSLVNLYALSFNKESNDYEIVSSEPETLAPISAEVSGSEQIDSLLKDAFCKHIEIDTKFVHFILADASIIDDAFVVSYYCWIPFGTKVKNCFYLPIDSPVKTSYAKIFNILLQKI